MSYINKPCGSHQKNDLNECILTSKIYDQLLFRDCDRFGPAISNQKCDCVIVDPCDEHEFIGDIIYVGMPINLPMSVKNAKMMIDSFTIQDIKILDIAPSHIKDGYWSVEVEIDISVNIQLYYDNMQLLKIRCYPYHFCKKTDMDHICAKVKVNQSFFLFGSKTEAVAMASDIAINGATCIKDTPHVMIKAQAYPLDVFLVEVNNPLNCDSVFDFTYEEPQKQIFIKAGLFEEVNMFRYLNLCVESNGICKPQESVYPVEDVCQLFQME